MCRRSGTYNTWSELSIYENAGPLRFLEAIFASVKKCVCQIALLCLSHTALRDLYCRQSLLSLAEVSTSKQALVADVLLLWQRQ